MNFILCNICVFKINSNITILHSIRKLKQSILVKIIIFVVVTDILSSDRSSEPQLISKYQPKCPPNYLKKIYSIQFSSLGTLENEKRKPCQIEKGQSRKKSNTKVSLYKKMFFRSYIEINIKLHNNILTTSYGGEFTLRINFYFMLSIQNNNY